VTGTKHDLTWSSLTLVSDQDDVVTGALQKLTEHVARRAGSEGTKDSLVGVESFHFSAGCGGHILENLRKAGVGGVNAQA
jgi:hypothetical protein